METQLINCCSCVIPTINFQWLKILLVSLLFFIVKYISLKQFVKLLMVKYTYLLIKYFCGDAFRELTLFSSLNFQIAIVKRNISVFNKQLLIRWMFLLVNEAWIFCYVELYHATSIQTDNTWHVIGKKYLLAQWNLLFWTLNGPRDFIWNNTRVR